MSDSLEEFLSELRRAEPRPEPPPALDGAIDPHRSDGDFLLFSADPCRGPWIRIPSGAVANVRTVGDVECGPLTFPAVVIELDPDDPATAPVTDGIAAGRSAVGWGPLAGAYLDDPDEGGIPGASHDVALEIRPEGRIYRVRLQVEGHEVKGVTWDAERKVYHAEVPGLVVEDALDVFLQAWGSDGASMTLTVTVDGRPMDPPMEARVTELPGQARRSYRV